MPNNYSQKARIVLLCVCLLLLCLSQAYAQDSELKLEKTGTDVLGGAGDNSFSNGDLNIEEAVDLFSGQHRENIPLVSVRGRNGMNVSVNLSYSGALKSTIGVPNYRSQASSIGLGFALPTETIKSITFNTPSLDDDKFLFITGGNTYELISNGDETYSTISGNPWIITRILGSVDGLECVIGWKVVKEDGAVNYFGDHDNGTLKNATRYQLRWQGTLIPGASANPDLYPVQWDLAKTTDPEDLNEIVYSYLQENQYVTIFNGYSSQSTNIPYTRASHVLSITAPGGAALRFSYSLREDYSQMYPTSKIQYYSTMKLDSIITVSASGNDISGVKLSYTYLNNAGGGTYKKLLLTDITPISVIGDSELLPTHFDYYTSTSDINYGAIGSIINPGSGKKAIHYKIIESDSNFADLSIKLSENMERYQASVASDMFYLDRADYSFKTTDANDTLGYPADVIIEIGSVYSGGEWIPQYTINFPDNKDVFGNWNGYWDWSSELHTSYEKGDYPVVSADGWMANFDRENNRIVVRRWLDGYWKTEYIAISWTPVDERVRLMAGNDYIVAYDMDAYVPLEHFEGWQSRNFFMYKWDDGSWVENKMYKYNDPGTWGDPVFVVNYAMSPDLGFVHFARRYTTADSSKSILAKYLYDSQTLSIAPGIESEFMYYVAPARAMQSNNFCAWPIENDLYGSESNINTHLGVTEWDGSSWLARDTIQEFKKYKTYSTLDSIIAPKRRAISDNVIFWEKYKYEYDMYYNPPTTYTKYMVSAIKGPTGWVKTPQLQLDQDYYDDDQYFDNIVSSNNLVITEHSDNLKIWQWTGAAQWTTTTYGYVPQDYLIRVLDNLVVTLEPDGDLQAKKLINNTTWSTTELLMNNAYVGDDSRYCDDPADGYSDDYAFTVQEDYIIAMNNSTKHVMLFVWEEDEWVDYDLSSKMETPNDTEAIQVFSTPTSFFIAQKLPGGTKHYCFKRYGTQFGGKAEYPVVDHLLAYRTLIDTEPTRVDFSYYGGILDGVASTPRFARSTVSLPYNNGGNPDGYKVHCFYNDIDDNSFSGSGIPGFTFPDLESASLYGMENGGYFLNGIKYLQYSFTRGDGPEVCNDTTLSYYSVYHPAGYPNQVFRVQYDSVHTMQDKIASNQKYAYESNLGRLVSTRTEYKFVNSYFVDSLVYASDLPEYTDMAADNCVSLVAKKISFLDNNGVDSVLGKSVVEYEKHGSWKESQSYIYENPTAETGQIIINNILQNDDSFNENGTLISSLNAVNDTTCVKLDDDGLMILATATNCYPNDFLVQDFEQNDDWDGWVMADDPRHHITDEDAFTGDHCYRLLENNTNPGHNWGPLRDIMADSLTDTLYYFSGWVKATHTVKIFVFGWDINDTEVPNGNKSFEFSNVNGTEWTKVEGVFNIANMYPNLHKFQFRVVLKDFETCPPDAWALFDDFRFHPFDAIVNTKVFDPESGRIVAMAGPDNVPAIIVDDTYGRDSLRYNHRRQVISKTEHSSSTTSAGHNWVKSTNFRSENDSTMSVVFSDGFGRSVQSRVLENTDAGQSVIVTGVKDYDSRGRVLREYISYVDMIAPSGLFDFSGETAVTNESQAYYSASGPGADCGLYPYSEKVYSLNIRSIIDSSASPGADWSMGSGHVSRFGHRVDVSQNLFVDSLIDADGIMSESRKDRWGTYTETVKHYTQDAVARMTKAVNYYDLLGQDTAYYIDTLDFTSEVVIKRNFYNSLSRVDSTWNRDNGMIRILYDKEGRIRFTQNNLRLNDNEFVYFKYDRNGRKIEEGVMGSAGTYFNSTYTNSRLFPQTAYNPDVKYRWIYDYAVNWYGDTLIAPGMLVRTENGDASYYREYNRFSETDSELLITKLPNIYYRKAVGHSFDLSGNLASMTFHPRYPSTTGVRTIDYTYDELGRLNEIVNGADLSGNSRQVYAEYKYNATSEPVDVNYGVHTNDLGGGTIVTETIQPYSYSYNPLSALTSINDLNDVVTSESGGGEDNIHFAQSYEFGGTDPDTYFNGRVRSTDSKTSLTSSTLNHGYRYTYNDLGWLTNADHLYDSWRSTQYDYNALGMRTRKIVNASTTDYIYWSGTSKLGWYTGLSHSHLMMYDAVGNLTKDEGNGRYMMGYNYRNLLTVAALDPNLYNRACDTLYFAYDESERRISKRYKYQIFVDCDPPIPHEMEIGGKSTDGKPGIAAKSQAELTQEENGTEKKSCIKNVNKYTYYLYDRGQVLATFNSSDAVQEFFVAGPMGRIATYRYNSDNHFYYHMGDHQHSERLTMTARFGFNPSISQKINFTPYGGVAYSTGNYHPRFTYSDKELDSESSFDLYNFGSRFYNPITGQFTSVDKAGQYPGAYLFAGNNPTLGIDRDGNFFWTPFIMAAVWATVDVGVAYMDGQRTDLLDMWLSSFAMNLATYQIGKWDLMGKLGRLSNSTNPVLNKWYLKYTVKYPIKGFYYSAKIGGGIGKFVNYYNTGMNLMDGNLRGAYFSNRYKKLDVGVAQAGFLASYTSTVAGSPSLPNIAMWNTKTSSRMAIVYKGGLITKYVAWNGANGISYGHNILINGDSWDRMSDERRQDLMRHEFVHTLQAEVYGPSLVGLYLREHYRGGSVAEPSDRNSDEYRAWLAGGSRTNYTFANKYEYEAYLEQFTDSWGAEVSFVF